MTIDLKVLIDAMQAMQMLRERADANMNTDEFLQALRAWSALQAHVNEISESVKVEVTV